MSNSTRKTWNVAGYKIRQPHVAFPLSPHPSGKWQKRINGRIFYFGTWAKRVNGVLVRVEGDGWKEAEDAYKVQASDLHAGRAPSARNENPNVADLCNEFLSAMKLRLDTGRKMSARMFAEYKATTDRLVAKFGRLTHVASLRAGDFTAMMADLAKQFGPVRQGNEVQKIKTVFKWGFDNDVIAAVPRYGSEFRKPGKDELRRHQAEQGPRLFTAEEVRRLIDAANPQLKAMIHLGANAAYGNTDCGKLPLSALDLDGGWATFPRPKNGIARRAKLWPETVAALREAIAQRPQPKDEADNGLTFVTRWGRPFAADGGNAVAQEFGKLLEKLKINGRNGLGFYSLRHTFRTVADGTKDVGAIRKVMGHIDDSIDANYTHGIDDERLVAVAEHVRKWAFPRKNARKGRVK